MKSWFPIDVEAWPEVSAMLEARGGEWPQWAATADLRWHVDQRKKFPTRPVLQARWGWSDRRVRAHLADTATWWDPSKGAPPESRPELRERVNRSGTDLGPKLDRSRTDPEPIRNEQTPVVKQKRTDPEPILDRERTDPEPEMSIARVHHPTPSPITTTPTGQHEQGASPLDPVHLGADPALLSPGQIVTLFQRPSEAVGAPQATTALGLALSSPSRAKPAPAKGIANPEVARVWEVYRSHHPRAGELPPKPWPVAEAVTSEGVEAILLVIEWAHTSEDPGAVQLREGGYLGETLFRPSKRGRYIELSAAWRARGRLAAPMTAGRQLSAREETNNDVDQWLANNRKPQRDVIEAEEPKWIR